MKINSSINLSRFSASFALLAGLGLLQPVCGQDLLFQESFETEGEGIRYVTENGSDDGENDFFGRRQVGSVGTYTVGGDIDGTWFWGAQDLDGEGVASDVLEADEGRVTWTNPISISGYGNLVLSAVVAQRQNEVEFDNALMFQLKIDDGDWFTIGGFRGTYTNSPGRYFEGGARTFPPNTNPRLTRTFKEYSWNIFTSGSSLQLRFFVNANGSTENYNLDNIRITGVSGLPTLGASASASTVTESADKVTVTFNLSTPAPAGGLQVTAGDSDRDDTELVIPETITIPGGASLHAVELDVINDNQFDSDEEVVIYFSADGYMREDLAITVTNEQDQPNVVITEIFAAPITDDLTTDSNADGIPIAAQDEMIEVVNFESYPVDISNWSMNDDLGPRHIFPEGTVLAPSQAVVIFGGGNPSGVFGGSIVLTASTGNNAASDDGDNISLVAGQAVIDTFSYTGELGETNRSMVLADDATGPIVDIQTIVGEDGPIFTPGLRTDGTPWQSFANQVSLNIQESELAEDSAPITATLSLQNPGSAEITIAVDGQDADEVIIEPSTLTVAESGATFTITPVNDGLLDGDRELIISARGEEIFPDLHLLTITDTTEDIYDIVINEALMSIFGTGADPNGNGLIEEPVEDQYIELVNASDDYINLANWQLEAFAEENRTGAELVHIFPQPTILPPDGAILVFGGGDPQAMAASGEFGDALIQVANQGGNGVNLPDYEEGIITLLTPFGYVEDTIFYDNDIADQSMSVTRSPDLEGAFESLHFDVSTAFELFSPGRKVDGTAFSGSGTPTPAGLAYFNRGSFLLDGRNMYDSRFGWLDVADWPAVYSYSGGSWWYAYAESGNGYEMYLYHFDLGTWIFTSYIFYPWYYDYNTDQWVSPN